MVPSPTADSAKKGKFAWKSQRNDDVVSKVIKSNQSAPFDPSSTFSTNLIPNRLTMDARPTHKSTDDLPNMIKTSDLSSFKTGPSKFGARSKIHINF